MVYYVEQGFVFGDVGHGCAVMSVTDAAILVNDADERHASEFENVDLLTIENGDAMFGVGDANEGNFFVRPILLKGGFGVWANGQDGHVALGELGMIIAEARQRRAAIRSHEAAQEVEQDGSVAKLGEADAAAVEVVDLKIGGEFARGEEVGHMGSRVVSVCLSLTQPPFPKNQSHSA